MESQTAYNGAWSAGRRIGAGNRDRTGDIPLGKLAAWQPVVAVEAGTRSPKRLDRV